MAFENARPLRRPLRLVIVDADHRVRESLAALVGSWRRIDVVGLAGHPAAAIDVIAGNDPDVVILDPRLPEVDAGLALVRTIRARWSEVGIVVMSWTAELESPCVEAGADGFVRKTGGPNVLVEAIVCARWVRARHRHLHGPARDDRPLTLDAYRSREPSVEAASIALPARPTAVPE